jgi:CRISPR-associated endonuclease Csn1
MDAIVIAFTTRNHVALLSNENALDKNEQGRYDLQMKLRKREKWQDKNGKEHTKFTDFIIPYEGFQQDVYEVLQNIVVSFKQNLRVLNKSNNRSVRIIDGKKKMIPQTKGDNWAIRKSLHKATVFGEVNLQRKKYVNLAYALQHINDIVEKDLRIKLRELVAEGKDEKQIKKYFASEPDVWADINLKKIEVYYYTKDTNDRFFAVRTALGDAFTADYIRNKVTDGGIQKILLAHLERRGGDSKLAFSPDGIEQMNADIQMLNNGVPHKPIKKVRVYEKAEKFAVGQIGSKSKKFVEADKGTNLFFTIYESVADDGKRMRSFVSVPLGMVIDCQKADIKHWKQELDKNLREQNMVPATAKHVTLLSPGDLVYVPTAEEIMTKNYSYTKDRIYKMVSSSGNQVFFILNMVASPILNKEEYSALNKMERAITGEMIKETCIPIKVDRLGNIIL